MEETKTNPETTQEKLYSDEDVNKMLAKAKYDAREQADIARKELLGELGIESIDEYKTLMENQKTEAQKLQEQLSGYEETINSYKEKEFNWEAELTANKLGVNDESLDDVLMLAKSKMSDDVSLIDAMKQVVEKYPHFVNKNIEQNNIDVPEKVGISYKENKNEVKENKLGDFWNF